MKFSFPSLDQIADGILHILKRFPFVVILSLVGTAVAIWFADLSYAAEKEYPNMFKLIFICGLGISTQLSFATFAEQKDWSNRLKWIFRVSGIALLAVYFVALGNAFSDGPDEVWYRYLMFGLVTHLLVAFAPFIGQGKMDQFWEYNKVLFLRILLSVLYSGALFIGLSIALLAIQNLLDIDIDRDRYLQLFFFLGGIFNAWFFLSGIPGKDEITDSILSFPKGLRLFSQYVLIPLVTVYIIILYLYLGKIIFQWELPNGWVSNLVLTFSIAGILSLLLLYPIRNSDEFKWVNIYSRGYYLALIPLIALLMVSIWVRISEYGVTVNRFYVATLGVWLTGIVIYFILSKKKDIKVIPVSLCLIALLTSFGPVGAFAVSERSQLSRFKEILSEQNMLNESGKVQKATGDISFEVEKELSSIVKYLNDTHGYQALQPVFEEDLDQALQNEMPEDSSKIITLGTPSENSKIMYLMGLRYISSYSTSTSPEFAERFSYTLNHNGTLQLGSVDMMIYGVNLYSNDESTIEGEGDTWRVSSEDDLQNLLIENLNTKVNFEVPFHQKVRWLLDTYPELTNVYETLPPEAMKFDHETDDYKVTMLVRTVSGNFNEDFEITNLSADFFIEFKQ